MHRFKNNGHKSENVNREHVDFFSLVTEYLK